MKYLKFLATTVAIIVSASVYAQTQNTPRRFDDSTGVRPWTGIVRIGNDLAPDPSLSGSGGAGNWCGSWVTVKQTDLSGTVPYNYYGGVESPTPVQTASHQPCQGYNLNASFPTPKCPPNYKLMPINGSWTERTIRRVVGYTPQGDNSSQPVYENVPFGHGLTGSTFTCMLQPTNTPVWVQNIGYIQFGTHTFCNAALDSNQCSSDIPAYKKKELFSDGTILDYGQVPMPYLYSSP